MQARATLAHPLYFRLMPSPTTSTPPTLQDQEKQLAAAAALRWVRDGMLVGLGSGSSSGQFILQLGTAVQNGL